jgi:NAD(P)H-dependent FMN reductase
MLAMSQNKVNPVRVAVLYGSTREGRFCDKVGAWAAEEISKHSEFAVDVIDPMAFQTGGGLDVAALKERVGRADAFVVVTPEYNHSYPAALKLVIDAVFHEWQAKPVGFVSYGGISGGLRAVEHLRGVFAELHAVTMRDSVSFAHVWSQFNAEGALLEPAAGRKMMGVMLRRLHWWAVALRSAREAMPYAVPAA